MRLLLYLKSGGRFHYFTDGVVVVMEFTQLGVVVVVVGTHSFLSASPPPKSERHFLEIGKLTGGKLAEYRYYHYDKMRCKKKIVKAFLFHLNWVRRRLTMGGGLLRSAGTEML